MLLSVVSAILFLLQLSLWLHYQIQIMLVLECQRKTLVNLKEEKKNPVILFLIMGSVPWPKNKNPALLIVNQVLLPLIKYNCTPVIKHAQFYRKRFVLPLV